MYKRILISLLIITLAILVGCSTMRGFVGEKGVGLQMKEEKPKPAEVSNDTTAKDFPQPIKTKEKDTSWDVF